MKSHLSMRFLKNTFSRVNRNTTEKDVFLKSKKKSKIGRDRPDVTGMAVHRFAITLVGNLTPFYNFIMFLAYF